MVGNICAASLCLCDAKQFKKRTDVKCETNMFYFKLFVTRMLHLCRFFTRCSGVLICGLFDDHEFAPLSRRFRP